MSERQNEVMSSVTNTSWIARVAKLGDASVIATHRYFRVDEDPKDLSAYEFWLAQQLPVASYIGFVAEAEGRVIAGAGGVVLNWGPTRGGGGNDLRMRVVNVFTHPAWRRRGIARQLVELLLKSGRDRGITEFCLAATEDSRRVYASLGFQSYPSEMLLRSAAR